MKASFAAIALSLGAALAAPSTDSIKRQQDSHPISVSSISLRQLEEGNRIVFLGSITRHDKSGAALSSTNCNTQWNPELPPGAENPVQCADPAFNFYFPTGVKSLENYDIVVNGPDGKSTGTIEKGPRYQCGPYDGTIEGIKQECKITQGAEFFLTLE
ncbi:hypothetical protein ASPVEDRAFT_69420 [Aspergillus versicolor CBS 583.65]|uniref:AA1-like domain-containing protein n=1 Tax=Aspergillus versicolor CBS 583.65 TaxID=1036611 RepID=A0A1L9PBL1_ASPVE|nr:uncharacterized protein ASPVEDRAFT_69420 [Aspergillus versicolor CBS 583.65]OJI98901.1 hypothetical protein ASPVEDRAFT_69420 [Aspergillus versicolor CBS 583.65]